VKLDWVFGSGACGRHKTWRRASTVIALDMGVEEKDIMTSVAYGRECEGKTRCL
jgi:hypothetical protein